ncbi:serine protease [Halorubrum sp. RMP-47]|uniref:Serine protease n=1 Tax=Halorubrum miltondacostae TaxID=3076378 RepID=A0ABD5M054_9EURY
MTDRTRKDVVKIGATGIVTGVAGCSGAIPEDVARRAVDGNTPSGEPPELDDFSDAELDRARSVGEDARAAVAVIRGNNGQGGTAWFLDDGRLITNSHVVAGSDSFEAWPMEGEKFEPELVGTSDHMNQPYHDVAVLETDFSPANRLSLGESDSVDEGQPLVQVGHPFAIGNWVVSIGRYVEPGFGETLLTSVPSLSGNSGGPLLTLDGSVVGITTGGTPRDQLGSTRPEPVDLTVHEEFTDYEWTTHDRTSVIRRYVEEF